VPLCLTIGKSNWGGSAPEISSGGAEPSTTHECCGRGKDRRCRGISGPPSVALLIMLAASDGEQDGWVFELLSSVRVLFGISSIVALSDVVALKNMFRRSPFSTNKRRVMSS